jgi:hypothetical protein
MRHTRLSPAAVGAGGDLGTGSDIGPACCHVAGKHQHATQLAAAGALVRVAGTGVNDTMWVASLDWQKWARALSDAGMAALKATEGKNAEALVHRQWAAGRVV